MLTKRIIPCFDVDNGRGVKGISFVELRDAGDPVALASLYEEQGADELVFLDITASSDERQTVYDMVAHVADQGFIPPTPAAGADPEVVARCAERFGSQNIVVAIAAKGVAEGKWEVYTHGGRRPTGLDAVEWAKRVVALGAGEILLTSMDADGHQDGYDLPLTRAISEAVPVPAAASGGRGGA